MKAKLLRLFLVLLLIIIMVTGYVVVSGNTVYPIKTTKTLTYWCVFPVPSTKHGTTFADIPLYKEIEKKTGVKVKFYHPPIGQEREQLNLMIASGDLPDIIEYNWLNQFPGGPEKALKDGIITPLNDLINNNAPNLKRVLAANPDVDKMVKTDAGKYYVFPFLRLDDVLLTYIGTMVRKDWLDDCGLPVPTTIDEWYVTLKAFKEKKNAEAPLVLPGSTNNTMQAIKNTGAFIGAYGIKYDFYLENGKVKYGPIEPAFKDFLVTMNKWYQEGLLDQDFGVTDRKGGDAKMLSDRAGALVGWAGGDMGKYLDAAEKNTGSRFDLVGAPYPTLKKGEKPKFGHRTANYPGGFAAAISGRSKNKELAAKYLDFAFSEEGHMLMNFGIEGVSYRVEKGYPKYTDYITNNAQLTKSEAMGGYLRASTSGPFVQDSRYFEQYQSRHQQLNAIKTWTNSDEAKHMLPPITATPEESSTLAALMNDIDTYREEAVIKFIFGVEPLTNFDKYVDQMKKLGIEKAIKIQEEALKRYYNR